MCIYIYIIIYIYIYIYVHTSLLLLLGRGVYWIPANGYWTLYWCYQGSPSPGRDIAVLLIDDLDLGQKQLFYSRKYRCYREEGIGPMIIPNTILYKMLYYTKYNSMPNTMLYQIIHIIQNNGYFTIYLIIQNDAYCRKYYIIFFFI